MAEVQNSNSSMTLKAGEDLSAYQFRIGILSAADTFRVTTVFPTLDAIGVLQNKPESATEASVAIGGAICKVELGATLSAGAIVSAAEGTGKAIAIAQTYYAIGKILQGGDDGDLVDMIVNPIHLPKA